MKYRSAWDKLTVEYKDQMQYDDGPPPTAVRMCHLAFGSLALQTSVQGKNKPLIDCQGVQASTHATSPKQNQ